ncbi:hypothetical protein B7486_36565 [cyanobacterium TDX16]|nr:hypothetical protein B7486_36565 [cyanobacterium TDX16]
MADKDAFLHPRHRYRGNFTPEYLVFNANLQEFAQEIGYIVSLQTNGKISTEEACRRIKAIWRELEISREELGIGYDEPTKD